MRDDPKSTIKSVERGTRNREASLQALLWLYDASYSFCNLRLREGVLIEMYERRQKWAVPVPCLPSKELA
jgi:hypothetical protein